MLPEIKAIEPQLKQILYECVEHVQATKAALYLCTSHDLNEKTYELVTSYQYNPADRKVVTANDDLVDRLAVKRNAFYINGLTADQRFAEMMFRQGNDRMLATPIFSRGRLVGFIDMRDKAGKKPFDTPDLEAARRIGDAMQKALGSKNLFGLGAIALVDVPQPAPAPMVPISAPAQQQQQPAASTPAPGQILSKQAMHAIESAREILSKRQLTQAAQPGKRALTDGDVDVLRLLMPAVLSMPGAVLASLSVGGMTNNPQALVAVASVADDAIEMLQAHVQALLKRANQPHMFARVAPSHPFGAQVVPVTASAISTIVTAPLNPHAVDGVLLTVAFERTQEGDAQRILLGFVKQLESAIDGALATTAGRTDRNAIAERLVEPDFQKFPELMDHCREVSVLAHRFAKLLELSPSQCETIRIAALVHDVGLRFLDYERLYKRPSLSPEELRGYAEHPLIGAALAEPLLGTDVAQTVLRHHERVDGKGYPSRLRGEQIPLTARVLQICDAWIALTSRRSYQTPMTRDEALTKLRDGAGGQWDGPLVDRFVRAVNELGG